MQPWSCCAQTAGTRQRTPWHQDVVYYDVNGEQNVSAWIPVDAVPLQSSLMVRGRACTPIPCADVNYRVVRLQFVPGSHTGPLFLPRTFKDGVAKWFPEGSLPELGVVDESRALGWQLSPGDAVFFHFNAVHSAAGSDTLRRCLSLRFIGVTSSGDVWVNRGHLTCDAGVAVCNQAMTRRSFGGRGGRRHRCQRASSCTTVGRMTTLRSPSCLTPLNLLDSYHSHSHSISLSAAHS
jgi:ectoine hydroxylase-related dioxygenase (phytanoyl-CoA dioxygenase family)